MGSDFRYLPEKEYKRCFRKLVGVWSEVYETRSGSGVGYPDLQLLVVPYLLPVELKSGVIVGGLLKPRQIKASQISWHHNFLMAGGKSWVVVCCGKPKEMDAWAIPSTHRDELSKWKKGFELKYCYQWVNSGRLIIRLSDYF